MVKVSRKLVKPTIKSSWSMRMYPVLIAKKIITKFGNIFKKILNITIILVLQSFQIFSTSILDWNGPVDYTRSFKSAWLLAKESTYKQFLQEFYLQNVLQVTWLFLTKQTYLIIVSYVNFSFLITLSIVRPIVITILLSIG